MARLENASKLSDYRITFPSQPFADFFNGCKVRVDALNSGLSPGDPQFLIGGILLLPITQIVSGSPDTFHTYGLRIKGVIWDSSFDPSMLEFYPSPIPEPTDPMVISDLTTLVLTATETSTTPIFSQEWEIVLDPSDPTSVTAAAKFFKITGLQPGTPSTDPAGAREFDLVFLEFSKFCELADIVVNPDFPTSPDYYIVGQTEDSYYGAVQGIPAPEDRGIQVSRATFDFDYSYMDTSSSPPVARFVDLGKARTLKFNPYPVPELQTYDSRAAVAYQLGIPCPPIWRNGGLSRMVEAMLKAGQKSGLIPEGKQLPATPPPPPAMRGDTSFGASFKNNKWFRLLLFLLGALLLAVLGLVCSK